MNNSKRRFERVNCDLPVLYEFVKWKINDHEHFGNGSQAHCVDISIAGIGVNTPIPLTKRLAAQLLKGTKKIRLSITLPDKDDPEVLFARLIWSGNSKNAPSNRYGFLFIDITENQFKHLQDYVNNSLKMNGQALS